MVRHVVSSGGKSRPTPTPPLAKDLAYLGGLLRGLAGGGCCPFRCGLACPRRSTDRGLVVVPLRTPNLDCLDLDLDFRFDLDRRWLLFNDLLFRVAEFCGGERIIETSNH